jgi:hypothetical protein
VIAEGSGCSGPIRIAGEAQISAQILELSRDLISEKEEVAFLEVGYQTGEMLDELKLRTKWKIFGLETSPSAARKGISERPQVFKATLEEPSSLSKITETFDLFFPR